MDERSVTDKGVMAAPMNSEQYEHHVASVLRSEGWEPRVTRHSRDLGVDVVAVRDQRRLAVQAKMYGSSSTKVNAEQIMCLHGAAAYADYGDRMLATDGQLTREAQLVAEKLGVLVRHIPAHAGDLERSSNLEATVGFGEIWAKHIEPLAGTDLARPNGKVMAILEADGSGVLRLTTGGTRQRIRIDTFRWTVERLLAGETVTRTQIHERDPRQVSSGVLLILATVPIFETVIAGGGKAIRASSIASASR